MVTDSSDIGGGAVIFQWQSLDPEQLVHVFATQGINQDGTLKTNYPHSFHLVPLGNWNWKWSDTRKKYHIWELEMLSGVLTLAANYRFIAGLPIVWLTDNGALTHFLDQEPPLNRRQRRWYVYLSQFPIKIFHLPGKKNELTDYLSRDLVEKALGCEFDQIAKQAFTRMDAQLDPFMDTIFTISTNLTFCANHYLDSELKEIWEQLEPHLTKEIDGWKFFRNETTLFRETRILVPMENYPKFCCIHMTPIITQELCEQFYAS